MAQLIVIDPGHGGARPDGKPGIDHGASCAGMVESEVALQHAAELGAALAQLGIPTAFTHQGTAPDLTLSGRAAFANTRAAAAFVSVHCNASGSTTAQGFQVFHANGSRQGELLARAMYSRVMVKVPRQGDRNGVFPDQTVHCGKRRLAVLRQTRMPAVLLELDFLTCESGRARLLDDGFRHQVAEAVADGLRSWLATL